MDRTCTARVIATSDPEPCPTGREAATVARWLEDRDYDSAPVYENERPIGYVTWDTADAAPADTPLAEITDSLTIDVVIAGDASFNSVLEALYERPFYYLADRRQVAGILTRADLNTEPVYQHLYTRLSRLERLLRERILEYVPDWREDAYLPNEVLEDIDSRFGDAKAAGVALAPIHYAQFSTLVTIIAGDEKCSNVLGFSAGHQASSRLNKITNLRNDVAHSVPILQNTNRGFSESGRTITKLLEQYELIEELLASAGE